MTRRIRLVAVASLLCTPAWAADKGYRPPRLPDGHVDLQGTWTHTNLTPFERPAEFQSLVITPAEAARIKGRLDSQESDLSKPNDPHESFDERSVEPIRGELHSSVIVDPPDGKIPGNDHFYDMVARARRSVLNAFDGPEQRPLSERCVVSPSTSPPVMVIPAGNLRQIVQTRDVVVIATEDFHDARTIRMNSKHVPAAIVTWTGDSIGWWEGDTLVVETKYLMPSLFGRMSPQNAYFVSPKTTVIERMRRIGPSELSYVFTIDDPTFYTRTWTGETRFTLSDGRIFESSCHEGNYSLPNVLHGSRVVEARLPH